VEEALKVRSEGPDPQELGHPVPISFILMRSPLLVLGATRFVAYSNGFRFMMIVAFRDRADPVSPSRCHPPRSNSRSGRSWTVCVDRWFCSGTRFADGSRGDNKGRRFGSLRLSVVLLGGWGGGRRYELDWFVTPSPPPGLVVFNCEWPAMRLSVSYKLTTAGLIGNAAHDSLPLFRQ